MEAVKVATSEYLSNDIFEEDFLKTFKILYRLQFMMGSCRIDAKNRFATPPTAAQKCFTVFCIIITAASNYALGNIYASRMKNHAIIYTGLSLMALIFISFFLNIVHVRFFNGDKNVKLYVRMQKIDRLLKIDQWKLFNKWVKNFTNVAVALILISFVVLMSLLCAEQGLVCICYLSPSYSMLTLLFELTACSSISAYFVFRLRFINCLMENYLAKGNARKARTSFWHARIRSHALETQIYYETSGTYIYLRELFKCFTMYQDLYKFQLLIFCTQSVVACVFSFEMVLISIQKNDFSLVELSTVVVLTVLYWLTAIFLCFRFELFFQQLRDTKRLCIDIMAKHHEGPLREKAWKMVKMINETPPRFSVYGMWDMNAAAFVNMFSLITSLIVTLLQLAFL